MADPSPEDAVNLEAARVFKASRQQFDAMAREWTTRCAQDDKTVTRNIAFPICIGLQSLDLPALVTLCIVDHSLSPHDDSCTMHFKWSIITAVKHFHQRAVCKLNKNDPVRRHDDCGVAWSSMTAQSDNVLDQKEGFRPPTAI